MCVRVCVCACAYTDIKDSDQTASKWQVVDTIGVENKKKILESCLN